MNKINSKFSILFFKTPFFKAHLKKITHNPKVLLPGPKANMSRSTLDENIDCRNTILLGFKF